MRPILTARVGSNADLFPDILRLFVPKMSRVLDLTYGRGVFWKKVNKQDWILTENDIDPARGSVHYDFRSLPDAWEGQFDAVIFDPPYLYVGGFHTLKRSLDRGYRNKERAMAGIYGVAAVDQMYLDGMWQAHKVLRKRGILICKCMDQVMSGEQVWQHITYHDYGRMLGFKNVDLFVLVSPQTPTMRHPPEQQQHARRNHSYFLVMRKR